MGSEFPAATGERERGTWGGIAPEGSGSFDRRLCDYRRLPIGCPRVERRIDRLAVSAEFLRPERLRIDTGSGTRRAVLDHAARPVFDDTALRRYDRHPRDDFRDGGRNGTADRPDDPRAIRPEFRADARDRKRGV